MELFFGKVDFEEYDNVDPSECFEFKGEHFWYRAVIDEDQVCFYDTCNRHFPIALENIKEADTVLFAARTLHEAHEEADQILEKAAHKVRSLLNFWDNE
jgi:hypothetical protein